MYPLLLLLLLPQLQFSLSKIILFFTVLFPYYKFDAGHIYHNICFICLLASDPVLLIKLLNKFGLAITHTHAQQVLNPWLLFSRQFKHTHTSTSFPWLQFGWQYKHRRTSMSTPWLQFGWWCKHRCTKYEHSMAAIFDSFWTDSKLNGLLLFMNLEQTGGWKCMTQIAKWVLHAMFNRDSLQQKTVKIQLFRE